MPGIFGGAGVAPHVLARLIDEWEAVWGDVTVEAMQGGLLGGHSSTSPMIRREADGALTAHDGSCGRDAAGQRAGATAHVGADGDVEIECDESGVIPLYYAVLTSGIVFSSLLRPLARALSAEPDPVGIAEFLRFAYTTAGRTVFDGVRRVAPGQAVTWSAPRGVAVRERGSTWVGHLEGLSSPDEAAEEVAPVLRDAVRRTLPESGTCVLMMSAGWDSRTLLATAEATVDRERLRAFSHGDLASRELRLASLVSRQAGVPWTARGIGPDVWDLDHLESTFRRTENLVFPHWSWAARANPNAACLFSGVLGEVLGGHYGATQVARGSGKGVALLRSVVPGGKGRVLPDRTAVERELRINGLGRPWYLLDDIEGDEAGRASLLEAMNAGISQDLERLQGRGVANADQLLEAFITEHRGVQYISAQALATRAHLAAGLPFADRDLLVLASRIPAWLKVHNRVSRSLGLRLASHLQRTPMAATLVPASWPLLAQEVSRVVRRLYEDVRRWGYVRTRGRIPPARLGWVDFEFLRTGSTLPDVVESLSADLWDRAAIQGVVRRAQALGGRGSLHPLFDQMGKILTVDRMLR